MGALRGFDDPQTMQASDDFTFMSVHFLHFLRFLHLEIFYQQ